MTDENVLLLGAVVLFILAGIDVVRSKGQALTSVGAAIFAACWIVARLT
mgnify:CR=1 FL=1